MDNFKDIIINREVVLEPEIFAPLHEVNKRIEKEKTQTGKWADYIGNWKDEGRI